MRWYRRASAKTVALIANIVVAIALLICGALIAWFIIDALSG